MFRTHLSKAIFAMSTLAISSNSHSISVSEILQIFNLPYSASSITWSELRNDSSGLHFELKGMYDGLSTKDKKVIAFFHDFKRVSLLESNFTGPRKINKSSDAEQLCGGILQKIQGPHEEWKLDKCKIVEGNDIARQRGVAQISFSLNSFNKIPVVSQVTFVAELTLRSAILTKAYFRYHEFKTPSTKISKDRAETVAEAQSFYPRKKFPDKHRGGIVSSRLVYAQETKSQRVGVRTPALPSILTLAWEVRFAQNNARIFIDAKDGSVIGLHEDM